MRILILGGTKDAYELAEKLNRRHRVTTALAGRTGSPRRPRGRLITGGFGGADGLAETLRKLKIELLIDATHPFAAQISAHAAKAARAAEVPLIRLERPPYDEPEDAGWVHVPDVAAAAKALPQGATALLTIGRQRLDAFVERTDCRFTVRSIEPPEMALPVNFSLILARPPFLKAEEIALMQGRRITHLVTKNSGGAATAAKLEAAYVLKIKVIMIDRPDLPHAETFADPDKLAAHVDGLSSAAERPFFLPLLRRIWAKSDA